MSRASGFTLLEALLSLSVASILGSALFLLLNGTQTFTLRVDDILDTEANLRLTPLLVSQWVSHAGNARWERTWPGLTVLPDHLVIESDFDGPEGFPDGRLEDSFERIALRQSQDALRLKSGFSSFQPVLRKIQSWETHRTSSDLLTLSFQGSLRPENGGMEPPQAVEVRLHLWNYRENLFPESRTNDN